MSVTRRGDTSDRHELGLHFLNASQIFEHQLDRSTHAADRIGLHDTETPQTVGVVIYNLPAHDYLVGIFTARIDNRRDVP